MGNLQRCKETEDAARSLELSPRPEGRDDVIVTVWLHLAHRAPRAPLMKL